MAIVFRSGHPNFPKFPEDIGIRLNEIYALINKCNANVEFVEKAFQLMEDCDLITEDNIDFLRSAKSCKNFSDNFIFPRNLDEGVLRYVTDDNYVEGKDGEPRFYSGYKRRVELDGDHYLISNDWYKDDDSFRNKSAFYNWIALNSIVACWKNAENSPTPETVSDNPEAKKVSSENNSETEKLLRNLISLVARLDSRVDNLENILGKMGNDIEELKNMWK